MDFPVEVGDIVIGIGNWDVYFPSGSRWKVTHKFTDTERYPGRTLIRVEGDCTFKDAFGKDKGWLLNWFKPLKEEAIPKIKKRVIRD